jgi:hypothetical protein
MHLSMAAFLAALAEACDVHAATDISSAVESAIAILMISSPLATRRRVDYASFAAVTMQLSIYGIPGSQGAGPAIKKSAAHAMLIETFGRARYAESAARRLLPITLPKRSSALFPARKTTLARVIGTIDATPCVGPCRRNLAPGDQPGKHGQ